MSAFEVLALNTSIPQIQAAQAGDSYVMVVNATTPALRITQTGTGNALEVEDSANPDATPFVVSAAGDVGIGTNAPSTALDVASSNSGITLTNTGASNKKWRVGGNAAASFVITESGVADRMFIDTSGNLGLGVTPNANWNTVTPVMQIGNSSWYGFSNETRLNTNFYYGSGDKYIGNGFATSYNQASGQHIWFNAPNNLSGANAPLSFNQAMTLDASGNLVVGATSTSYRMEVVAPSGDNITALFRSGDSTAGNNAGGGFRNISSATAASRQAQIWLDADGANFSGGDYFYINKNGNSGTVDFVQVSNAAMTFATDSTERARITSGGYFKASNTGTYVGSTGAYHELRSNANETSVIVQNTSATLTQSVNGIQVNYSGASPNGTSATFLYCNDSTALRASIRSNGGLANYQSNNVDLSDARTKTDINPLGSYWSKIAGLEIVSYKYKDQTHDDLNIGVIAQQVEQVAPEFVDSDGFGDTPEDGVPLKTIYNKDLTFAAIKALQEAMARIETLEAEVAALKGA